MADLGLYENFLEHAHVTESILYRRQSVALRKRELAFNIPDSEFVGLYRLNKSVCSGLIDELEPYLPSRRQGGINTTSMVLSTLSFYASGCYQRHIGVSAHHKMHQVSFSNCMRAVTQALNNDHFRRKYINFPQTREERNAIKHGFSQKFGMRVLGCIDGTHIAIVKPAEYEDRFINRKHYHSLNAQIVCDSDLNILSIDASHGGANHDSLVWRHHALKSRLEQLHQAENETVWFLGDSGYPLRPTLMTPIVTTEPDSPQRHYTELHCRARNTVERCIGVLKSRWRCLLVDRKLHYHPTMAGLIVNACVVLHNIANAARLPIPTLTSQEEQDEANMQIHSVQSSNRNNHLAAGESVKNDLVQRLWSARRH